MIKNSWEPLYSVERAGLEEVAVHGSWAAWSGAKLIKLVGSDALIFSRSLMKPFQMKVFAHDLENVLNDEAKALSTASHSGQDIHLSILATMIDPATEAYRHVPAKHTCSGKHTAILRGCELRGWPLDSYLSPEHPYQQALLNVARESLGATWTPQVIAVDGCGLPTMSMTVVELAHLFADLACHRANDWIFHAMSAYPQLVGGTNRLDTTIMTMGRGKLLAKEGADGLLGLSIIDERYPHGLGVVIKIASGYDPVTLAQVAREILREFDYELPSTDLFHLRSIVPRASLKISVNLNAET